VQVPTALIVIRPAVVIVQIDVVDEVKLTARPDVDVAVSV
jgi:hypothetical protein